MRLWIRSRQRRLAGTPLAEYFAQPAAGGPLAVVGLWMVAVWAVRLGSLLFARLRQTGRDATPLLWPRLPRRAPSKSERPDLQIAAMRLRFAGRTRTRSA